MERKRRRKRWWVRGITRELKGSRVREGSDGGRVMKSSGQ